MDVSSDALKKDLREGLTALQTLRDEIRVRLHLAGMEAKTTWGELENHLLTVEDAAKEASASSRTRLNDALEKLRQFRASLK
jgi:hypothetical protein